jgi:hypothetical protein
LTALAHALALTGITGYFFTHETGRRQDILSRAAAAKPPRILPLLPEDIRLLLDVPLRFQHMPGVHAGKCLGVVLQRDHLAVP